ncbi:MAG: hypothetical protein ACRCST_06660 [Turicibacter sp.]
MLSQYQPVIGWVIDCIVLSIVCFAAIYGYKRSYRNSFVQLIVQLITILISYSVTILLLDKVLNLIPSQLSISKVLPDNLFFLVGPYEDSIIQIITFIILYISTFVIIKGFLFVFSRNYKWEMCIKKEVLINKKVDGFISGLFTVVNSYTYIIVILVFFGFPIFNLVGKNSISENIIKSTPIFSKQIQGVYAQYSALNEVIKTYGEHVDNIYDGKKINFDELKRLVDQEKINSDFIESAYKQFIPMIANEESYLSYFNTNPILENEMQNYIDLMSKYTKSGIISIETLNLYYKELLDNGTYAKLIEDEVITSESLKLLLKSNLLDNSNVEKIKEYL